MLRGERHRGWILVATHASPVDPRVHRGGVSQIGRPAVNWWEVVLFFFECKKSNLSNYTLKVYFQFRFHSHCTTIRFIRGNASDDNHQPRIQMSPSHLLGSQSLVKSQSSHL